MSMRSTAVIVLNWNGKDSLKPCLESLLAQSVQSTIFVVENGSTDGSLEYLKKSYPDLRLIVNQTNLGFAGGANCGIREAIRNNFDYVGLFNNDAVADKDWLKNLVSVLDDRADIGIVTCKLVDANNKYLDSTGDTYTVWGLPYPRGRGELVSTKYDDNTDIFAATGGASLYRVKMLEKVGLFDEDFFAYYEDVDLSFRAQLTGWKVCYTPRAIAYHQIGATSSKIKGFTTFQTIKNLPWLLVRNVPGGLLSTVWPRFLLAYSLFIGRAVGRGDGLAAFKGLLACLGKMPKKWRQRRFIQSQKSVGNDYIWSMMTHDLPTNAYNLRKLRTWWWQIRGKNEKNSN
ncbi:MAG: glycosyltransferase family 2 protein [Candidatus Saccharimonadales bacterium]